MERHIEMSNERKLTEAEQAVLDRAERIEPSDWQVTEQGGYLDGKRDLIALTLEARTETGVRFKIRAKREYTNQEYMSFHLYAVTPSGSDVRLDHDGGLSSPQLVSRVPALYLKLHAHFLPAIQAAQRQQADEERKRQKDKEDDILRYL